MLAGAVVLPAGHRIRPVDVAAVAAAGYVSLSVRRRPRVAIVPTGDEIRPLGSSLLPGEILDTNSLMLEGLLEDAGCEACALPVVADAPDDVAAALAGAAQSADVVLVLAGSSAGRDDHTRSVIDRLGRVAVHGVAMRPGHPVVLGVLGGDAPDDAPDGGPRRPAAPPVPVVGVPGYPASAERALHCYVLPLISRILGVQPEGQGQRRVTARLATPVSSPRQLDEYLRVRLASVADPTTATEGLVAVPLPRGAGAVSTLVRAEAVLRLPVGTLHLPAGHTVSVVPVPGATFAAATTIVAGRASTAVDALVTLHRENAAACVLHWSDLSEAAALQALAAGLCHAAAVALPLGEAHVCAVADLIDQLGPLTVLEIARTQDRVDALVVPAAAFDSEPIVELRSTLGSMPFRRRLREIPGWSGRTSGRETWHGPTGTEPHRAGGDGAARQGSGHDDHDGPVNGAARCATR
jgi:putative molybdopterin biosynthesis protein